MTTFRRTTCKHCRKKITPGHLIHPECIDAYAESEEAKTLRKAIKQAVMQAKVERAETRRRKEENKTIPQLIKEAQFEFNAFIRFRDAGKNCICCGLPLDSGGVGGAFDCGHYRSVGSASHLRFNEDNAHGQRKQCNRWGAGRAVDYRIGLIARIGLGRVVALESSSQVHKWTRDELRGIRDHYRAKLKELKAA